MNEAGEIGGSSSNGGPHVSVTPFSGMFVPPPEEDAWLRNFSL